MHVSVQGVFRAFNEPFEGVVHHMYLDIKGLVTIGVGNLIDPLSRGGDPARFSSRSPERLATQAEIESEWKAIKANTAWRKRGIRRRPKVTELELKRRGDRKTDSEAAAGE